MNRSYGGGSGARNNKQGQRRDERPQSHSYGPPPAAPYQMYNYPVYPEPHGAMPPPYYPPNYYPYAPPPEFGGYPPYPGPPPGDVNRFSHAPPPPHYPYPPPGAYPMPPQSWTTAPYQHNPPHHQYIPPPHEHHSGPSKEEIIKELEESRLKVEMPCRTLFVRNLGYKADGRKIEAAFAKYGTIKDVSDLIEKRGLMFITFYDIRHAEAAMGDLNGATVENRKLDVHYSLPKQDVNVQGTCTKENNQGTLLVHLVGAEEPVNATDLERLVKVHGDVRRVRDFRNNDLKKFFEFHDSRDCVKAFNALQNSAFKGGKLQVEFAWDLPENIRLAQAQLRGDPLKDGGRRGSSTAASRREYDRFVPSSSSASSHRRHRSRSRSRSPIRRPKPAPAVTEEAPLVIYEDKTGDPRLRDPRISRPPIPPVATTATENTPNEGNSALFEQMSNLLTILNKPKPAPNQTGSSGPSSAEAAHQLAQLLIDQKP